METNLSTAEAPNASRPAARARGITVRRAALIAGLGYLLSPVSYAEYSLYPKLVIPGNIHQTVANIGAHPQMFAAAIVCYLTTLMEDVVIAWALYYLLAPVSRPLSMLTAWFRVIYAAVALFAWLNLVTVFHVVTTPDYTTLFGSGPLEAQVRLLLGSFRYQWSISLVIFGIHLILLGYLIYRSRYIPRIIGILLVIDGLGWMVDSWQPFFYANAKLGFVFVTFFGELVFMLWLLIWGWRIKEPAAQV